MTAIITILSIMKGTWAVIPQHGLAETFIKGDGEHISLDDDSFHPNTSLGPLLETYLSEAASKKNPDVLHQFFTDF